MNSIINFISIKNIKGNKIKKNNNKYIVTKDLYICLDSHILCIYDPFKEKKLESF